MKLKLKDIFNARTVLSKIANSPLNPKVAVKLGCLMVDLKKYFDSIEQERSKLINELGTKNKDGSIQIIPSDKNYSKFIDQFTACLGVDIDFNLEFPIDLDELEGIKITPIEAQTINAFIEK